MTNQELKKLSYIVRQDIIKMITKAGSGHPAGSLGIVEILVVLYGQILEHRPQKPNWFGRDRFILSAGHLCPALYSVLARHGYFDVEKLATLRELGSFLQGHPALTKTAFIEASTGSLGHGLSIACGMSLVAQIDKKDYDVWVLMSDAEQQEGTVWEAAMLADKYKLGNLKAIIDYNNIQLSGDTTGIMPIEPLEKKYVSFGWQVFKTDGHDLDDLKKVFLRAQQYDNGPCVVLVKTVPGKGVSFMEGKWQWHGRALSAEQTNEALRELKSNFENS